MAYNKKSVLERNIEAIKIALSKKKVVTEEDKRILESYQGFGGIKAILLPHNQPELFTNADNALIPLIEELHEQIKNYSKDSREYDDYIRSIKNSVLTSFYTPVEVIKAINDSFSDISFTRMLEPSAGAGAFLKYVDAKEKVGIEKDLITGRILEALNPDTEIYIEPFEKIKTKHIGSYDLVASNIPFGNFMVFDPIYAQERNKDKKKSLSKIHDYFFLKGIDMLKDGGVLAFITSTGVMDSSENAFVRKAMLENTHLISAIRLPENLFSNTGGIEVHSDLIVLQKDINRSKELSRNEKLFLKSTENINDYYQDLQHVIHSRMEMGTNQFGKPINRFFQEGGEEVIAQKLRTVLTKDIAFNFNKELFYQNQERFIDNKPLTSPIQLDLFANPYEFAEQVKQPDIQIKTKEELYFEKQYSDYLDIKSAYYTLQDAEEGTGLEHADLRLQLNNLYDSFINNYGILHKVSNSLIISDNSYKEVRGIEILVNKEYVKSDIFIEPVTIIKDKYSYSIEEALSASMNELNIVDLDYISGLSGESKDAVKQALVGETIFYNPLDKEYQISSKFLSGNVIDKLERIKSYASIYDETLYVDPIVTKTELKRSIAALENIQPATIPLEEIGLNLGERWIPNEYYESFSKSILNPPGTPEYEKGYLNVRYFPGTDTFDCKESKLLGSYAYGKFAVSTINRRYTPEDVFKFALMDTIPNMTKKVMRDGEEVVVPDKEGIQKFTSVVDDIRSNFKIWLLGLPEEDKIKLETIYNRKFNNIVKANYDGSFQTFPDLQLHNIGIDELYPSQKNTILMLKNNGGGIVDHEVGGGKTLIMCITAYEMKRLGLANKPLLLGLKANVHEIAATYKNIYPNAKILYPDKKELANDSISSFLSKIQNNNWDSIIMSHEQFEKIPQSLEIQKKIETEELNKLEDTIKELKIFNSMDQVRDAYKRLESKKENLSVKIQNFNLQIEQKKNQSVVDFKTMGIDFMLIDESHKYKNLPFTTKHTRAAGLGTPKGSQRAQNLLYAIRTIQERTGKDLGASYLSGTTISNSVTELYGIFNCLRPKALQEQGIFSFDGWLATYAEKTKEFEFSVTNDIIMKERFRQFCKVPELSAFYAEITDYKTAEMIGVDRPDRVEHLVNIEQTPDQVEMYARLKDFAKSGDGTMIFRSSLSESEQTAKMLIATNTAKKAALDMRLIDPHLFEDHDGNKINACVRNILHFYDKYDEQKGTQFVFCDLGTYDKTKEWNVYSELKEKLIDAGLPEHEIQFIHNYKTDKKRAEFQSSMNSGLFRVSIGSTEMMGTGINAQKKAVAVHHLDIPWTPKDFIQRDGRAVRAGNEVAKNFCDNKVHIFIYAVEKTLDVYKFNLQATKANFIAQIKSNTVGVRMIDEGGIDDKSGMSYNEYIAILSGDTSLLQKAKLEKKIGQLKAEETAFYANSRNRERDIENVKSKIDSNKERLERLEGDLSKFMIIPRKEDGQIRFKINLIEPVVNKEKVILPEQPTYKTYTNIKEAGIVLNSIFEIDNKDTVNTQTVGDFYGFPIAIRAKESKWDNSFENSFFVIGDNILYTHNNSNLPRTPELAGEYAIKCLEKIEGLVDKYKKVDVELLKDLNGLMAIETKIFPKTQELTSAERELKGIIQNISSTIEKNKGLEQDKIGDDLTIN